MQFSEITKTVQDVWDFSWPPVITCLIFFWIADSLNEEGARDSLRYLLSQAEAYGQKVESIRIILEPYGLTTIIPFVSLVALIGSFYILNGPLTKLSYLIPPYISFRPFLHLVRGMTEKDKILLIRKYPSTDDITSAYNLADSENKILNPSAYNYSNQLTFKVESFIKLGFIALISMTALNVWSRATPWEITTGFLKVFSILSTLWVLNFTILLWTIQQALWKQWSLIRIKLLIDSPTALDKEPTEAEIYKIQPPYLGSSPTESRWWKVYFINRIFFEWIKYTFFEDGRR
ncbi:hypothetical protein P3T65_01580 [Pseudomonas nitroreducens]|uniref:hypothetical protein n=1 Tax=Pseudomonas nitroreducens TaxID=46680 RepID=UPI0023F853E8|nr:hypothetical protein [Pseudomonas nitroreducens]WEW98422.1 hypothetical protein P3T65_01580 [Pseudomonas nitroreducens]